MAAKFERKTACSCGKIEAEQREIKRGSDFMAVANFEFEIPGKAVAQARPRFTSRGSYVRAYEPQKCSEYKQLVRRCAYEQCAITAENAAYAGPAAVTVIEFRAIPKSWSKKRHEAARNGVILPLTKPDTDNVLKGIKDALTGVLWADDAQVVHDMVMKFYDDEPYVTVQVSYLDNSEAE